MLFRRWRNGKEATREPDVGNRIEVNQQQPRMVVGNRIEVNQQQPRMVRRMIGGQRQVTRLPEF